MTHAADNLRTVALDLHATSAPVAPLPAFQFTVDSRFVNGQPGGQAFHDGDERASVRFSGSRKTKHKDLMITTFNR
jgi:hypothetical protein